ncbi:uncharacterized protein K02A2.6-like isoform X1 [Armigeres subalbatus]|uniref:uncharacterized protein K02A2.6-like isoform X1 n=1 Tax=Armigeres subalbatus TaxID=124917 RepID=UPI002ED67FF7
MEVDTGSAVTVISERLYTKLFSTITLFNCNKSLVVVNGAKLNVVGHMVAHIMLNGHKANGKLIVLKTDKDFRPLLGRDLMSTFYPNWKNNFIKPGSIKSLQISNKHEEAISMLREKYAKVFSNDLSNPISGFEADLVFKSDQPIFRKPYQVPYKIKNKFLEHLDGLEKQGIITPIKASEWAAPVIAILKKDNELRMIALGTHLLTAHRNQLKMVEQKKERVKVMITGQFKARRSSIDEQEEFLGFPPKKHRKKAMLKYQG